MSSTASNYNITYLVSGIALSLLSVVLATSSGRSLLLRFSPGNILYGLVLLLYSILMFASSYVEEEHHFWYWTTSAWVAWLFFGALQSSFIRAQQVSEAAFKIGCLLLLHRLVRAWNQTGQKHAGAPDLVTSFLLPNPWVIWVLVGITYFSLLLNLSNHFSRHIPPLYHVLTRSGAAGITVPAFIFKLSFTARDAPEIVRPVFGSNAMRVLEGLPLVLMARAVFLGCALGTLWAVGLEIWERREVKRNAPRGVELLKSLHTILSVFLITQTRAHNIPLFLLFHLQLLCLERSYRNLPFTQMQISTSTLLFAHASFFALGNTNAISSIDLSNAYNGVAGYDVGVVGLLVFLSNWSGPVWWAWAAISLLATHVSTRTQTLATDREGKRRAWIEEERERLRMAATPKSPHLLSFPEVEFPSPGAKKGEGDGPLFGHLAVQTTFIAGSLLAVMAACTALRTHLFIWTVFSPKYLYAMAWSLGWHLVVSCVGLGGIWWAVGVR